VIEAMGRDPEETDARIKADKDRESELGLKFGAAAKAPPPMLGPDGKPMAPATDDEGNPLPPGEQKEDPDGE